VTSLALKPGSATVYAGTKSGKVFKSDDGGSRWAEAAAARWAGAVKGVATTRDPAATIYVATENGVFKSSDGAATWTASNTGLSALAVWNVVADPSSPSQVYALSPSGLWRSSNAGSNWSALSQEASLGALAIAPDGSTLYAGSRGSVWKSQDGGRTWKEYLLSHGQQAASRGRDRDE
jgi:photosystem II stability/assembly factor-like uncharacterized protein